MGSKLFATSLIAALLAGCGGGSDDAASTANSTTPETAAAVSISGGAIKGVVSNAIIRVYGIEAQGDKRTLVDAPFSAETRTRNDGQFSISIPRNRYDDVVIELSVDGDSRMTCDIFDGCGFDANGDAIAFGDLFALDPSFRLTAALTGLSKPNLKEVYLTPLTHLATRLAETLPGGLTVSNINQAYLQVETDFALAAGALALQPPDLTRLENTRPTADELHYALVSAAFLGVVDQVEWEDISDVIAAAEANYVTLGSLRAENLGALPDVTFQDLFFEISDLAGDLQQVTGDISQREALQQIELLADEQYGAILNQIATVEPPSVISHPQSITVDATANAIFSVAASSDSALFYQWRKNGAAISGAQGANLVLSVVQPTDAGQYDVIVSNEAGSVTSFSASLVVNALPTNPDNDNDDPAAPGDIPGSNTLPLISAQPQDQQVNFGTTARFSIAASAGASLQWRKNGQPLAGETGSNLTVINADESDAGNYDCLVSNSEGTLVSEAAELTINANYAQLSWFMPTERSDGTTLYPHEIEGYLVRYGNAADNLTSSMVVEGAQTTDAVLHDLQTGTLFFAVLTRDVEGLDSNLSAVVSKQITQ